MKGTCLKGRYLLGEVIGKGGMAVVYKAYDFRSGRTVAVKVLREQYNQDAEFVRRFEQEAEAASAISHENLIDIYDVGEQNGTRFIVMEYVDGMTLKSLIKEHGALDNYSAITIARQICTALQIAHDAHIIHRDIKPQNILLDRRGVAKLSDFGIAKTSDTQTITGGGDNGVLGSVHYFAPEQARGEGVNACSDLYSLGVVMYEMVTAKLPFTGDTPVAIALQHMSTAAVPPIELNPKVTHALNEIILKAIRKNPEERYQSGRELYDDLSMALVYPEGGFIHDKVTDPPAEAQPDANDDSNDTDQSRKQKKKNRPKSKQKTRRQIVRGRILKAALCVLILAAAITAVCLSANIPLPVGKQEVPSVVGVKMEEAAARLDAAHLVMEVGSTRFDETVAPGIVLEQLPTSGSTAKTGDTVKVTVSAGPETARLPDLSGKQLEEAQAMLELLGLKVSSVNRVADSDQERNSVIGQAPVAGSVLRNGDSVELTISDPPILRTVPELGRCSLEAAQQKIEEAGLSLGAVEYDYATGYELGQVYRQSPEAGAQLREGDAVNLWVVKEVKMYTCKYQLTLDIRKDDSEISIFVEDASIYKEISSFVVDRGTLDVELNLENENPGEKTLIIMVNDEEIKRESVVFAEEEQ